MLQTILHSSLHRAFPSDCPDHDFSALSGLRNEPLSFQLSFRLTQGRTLRIYPRIHTDLPVSLYRVGYVPVMHTDTGFENAPPPGMFGDLLLPKAVNPPLEHKGSPWGLHHFEKGEKNTLNAANDCWQTLWLTVNENAQMLQPGRYTVRIDLHESASGDVLTSDEMHIDVLPAVLPHQKLMYTCWFHCDCLADFYGVEVFSDRFFELMQAQVEAAARNGMNMILTPCFTPALDTPEGDERMTVQLVGVTVTPDGYRFDFSLLKRFIDVCLKAGIEYFEHCHLFSQWGAAKAPKVVGMVNGVQKTLFGWDTPADGEAYTAFLRAYLPAVKDFLRSENLLDKTLFHISDEPTEATADTFRRAVAAVGDLLDGCMTGDALEDFRFYEEGLVKTPIVKTPFVHNFAGRCEHLWAYYTGGEVLNGLSNRIITMPPERNRMLGIQLYWYRIEGFLHWAYNYYYDLLSQGLFDPKVNPCGYNNNPCTICFVYPGQDGSAIQSMRQKVFGEGLVDLRALQLLESLAGREACEEIIRRHFGDVTFFTAPENAQKLLAFREDLNRTIAGYC